MRKTIHYPTSTKMNWLETIRLRSHAQIFLLLFTVYVIINLSFAVIYYKNVPLSDVVQPSRGAAREGKPQSRPAKNPNTFLDSAYFSFVTGSTLGYGDYTPKNMFGKLTVIVHVTLSTALFALIISTAFLKMLYPRNTIILAEKILYSPEERRLSLRAINVNKAKLINPEFRIVMGKHTEKHGVSHHAALAIIDDIPCLGKHDIILNLKDAEGVIWDEIQVALSYNAGINKPDDKSRFRIKISICGSYGFSSYSYYHQYTVDEVFLGQQFETIEYPESFHGRSCKYNSIPGFWDKFNTIIGANRLTNQSIGRLPVPKASAGKRPLI